MPKSRQGRADAFAEWEKELAKRKAKGLIGKYGFTKEDQPDLEQEMLLQIHLKRKTWASWKKKEASEETALSRILDNKIRDIIDEVKADKRKIHSASESLDKEIVLGEGEDVVTYETFLSEDRSLAAIGRMPRARREELDIELGLSAKELTRFQRKVLKLLREGMNVSETAKALRTSRTQLHREIAKMGEVLYARGLKEYI